MYDNSEKIDFDAVEWMIENGHTLSTELVKKIVARAKSADISWNALCKHGCGYRECGMAESGFSDDL